LRTRTEKASEGHQEEKPGASRSFEGLEGRKPFKGEVRFGKESKRETFKKL